MHGSFHIHSICRYPVKGFQGTVLDSTTLDKDCLLPGDRAWGFTSGHAKTAEVPEGEWMKKAHFLQLMRFAELANLSVKFDNDNRHATLLHKGEPVISGDMTDLAVANAFCSTLQDLLTNAGADLDGNIGLRHLQNGGFSDTQAPWISLGGTASLKHFATATVTEGHPERFRLNIWLETNTPFEELSWVGRRAQLGTALIHFMEPVGRCAAINVHPETAERAGDLPADMRAHYGHSDLGVFALVEQSGTLSNSDKLTLLD